MRESKNSLSLVHSSLFKQKIRFSTNRRKANQLIRGLKKNLANFKTAFALQEIRDNVYFKTLNKKSDSSLGSTLAFSGVVGHEGVTTLSILMALALGELKRSKILFIDGSFNLQNFNIFREFFELTKNSIRCNNGFEYLRCYSSPGKNLCFMTGINILPVDFFSNPAIPELIQELKESFDYVIFDMPPMLTSSETKMFFSVVDFRYLVLVPGKTLISDVDKCKKIMSETGTDLNGVILNRQKIPLWARFLGRDAFV